MFHEDKLPSNAILIEYIPDMQSIGLSNFSQEYLDRFRQILHDMIFTRQGFSMEILNREI